MEIPIVIKRIAIELLKEYVQDWSCDEFTVNTTPEVLELAKDLYGEDYSVETEIYFSMSSILQYWLEELKKAENRS